MSDERFADVQIQVGMSEPIPAHSFVLAGKSDVLADMIKAAPVDASGRRLIKVASDSKMVWQDIVRFAYSETWEPQPTRLIELLKVSDRIGFASFSALLSEKVAAMFANNVDDALLIGAQAWRQGDKAMARSSFLAALKSPSKALDSPSMLALPADAFAEYLGDDRADSDEVRVFRAAVRWAVARLEAREAEGEVLGRASWWTEELEAAELAAKSAVEAAEAAAAEAAAGSEGVEEAKEDEDHGEEAESKEPEAESGAGGPPPAAGSLASLLGAIAAPDTPVRRERVASESASVASSSSGESTDGLALGGLAALFRTTSTGSIQDSAALSASFGVSAKKPAPLVREWVRTADDRRPWDEWTASYAQLDPISTRLTPKFSGEALREALGPVLACVRWPLIPAWFLANEVAPMELLPNEQLAALMQYRFLPPGYGPTARLESMGMVTRPRTPVEKLVRVMLWGGGGASGKYEDSGAGGAGGYLCVELAVRPGETLKFYIGEGGYADKSSSELTTRAWPNGGRGGYNWKTGGGGGATYFEMARFGSKVVAGAGGGGGGSAGRSFSSGGGGGGGTSHGKVGSGGDGQCPSSASGVRDGTDGNGDGGNNDSGSRNNGANNNGAGGRHGASTSASGGAGGGASWACARKVRIINASSYESITCPFTALKAGEGGHTGTKGGDRVRGAAGMAAVLEVASGVVHKIYQSSAVGPGGKTGRASNTVFELSFP